MNGKINFIIEAGMLERSRFRKELNDSAFMNNGLLEITIKEDKRLFHSTFYVSVHGEVEKVKKYVSHIQNYVEGVE